MREVINQCVDCNRSFLNETKGYWPACIFCGGKTKCVSGLKMQLSIPEIFKEFNDKANGIRFNSRRDMKEYEAKTGSVLLSNEEIRDEISLKKKRKAEKEEAKDEAFASEAVEKIKRGIPVFEG